MSSLIAVTQSKRRMQNLETLHYYVLHTLFPLAGYLNDQCSDFFKSWIANLDLEEFPDLIEYCTTIGNGTLLKKEHTTNENHAQLKDIDNSMYLTQVKFKEVTPNQILHMLSILILSMKTFYSSIGQYPTLYDFLAII